MPLAQSRSSVPGPPAGRPCSERGRSRKGVSPLGRHAGAGGRTRREVVGHAAPLAALGGPPHACPGGRGRRVVRPDGWKGRRSLRLPCLLQVPQPRPRLVLERAGCARLPPVDAPGVSAAAPSAPSARGPQPALLPLLMFPPESRVYKQKETTHDQTGHKVTPPGPAK